MNGSVLPESLDSIQKSDYFPSQRHRWNTNEEIAAILIAIDKHEEWLSKEVKIRPKSGSMMLYSRKRVRYRRDGYCWKKRKDGKTTREDHMKLKVQGQECIYGCYVHSAILPTFHRRCYWLLQNPDIVLVHYLNVPYSDDNKVISPALNYFADNKKEWTKDELISELKPMFFSENEPDLNNELEKSTVETIEAIVQQLMVKQRAKVKALEDASDGGINAKALTVVNAITNSAKQQQQQNANKTVSHIKNKQSLINKRDVSTCIITTHNNNNTNDSNSSKHMTSQGTVQLLQLSSSGQSGLRTGSNPNTNSSQSAPTSLIFNLSQFQSGSGLLILNSPTAHSANSRSNESHSMTTPLTLLYGRPHNQNNNNSNNNTNNNNSSSSSSSSNNNTNNSNNSNNNNNGESTELIGANLTSKSQEMTINCTLDNCLNNINRLNAINLMNGENCSGINYKINNNLNNKKINNGDIDKVINNLSDNENSVENKIEDNKNSINSVVNSQDSDLICYNEESMIVNSNPSTPEHMKTSQLNVQTIQTRVDLNCNLLNHSQPQHSSLSHNHSYSFNHYYNSSNLNNNQNNTNINQNNNSLLSYDMDPNDLNPMDFIDNDIPTPDETLFNLDTFDILGDINNLDDLTNNTNTNHFRNAISLSNLNQNKPIKSESSSTITSAQEYRELAANIADYSPEWCYPEGGIKVLVAGPWFTSTYRYTILFDGVSVATQLVQNGLLRCYSPEHEPGFVTLQVACDGLIISNSVIFEYRDHPSVPIQKTEDYFSIDENIFKFSLLERFELLESRLSQSTSKRSLTGMESTKQFSSFEDRLVFMCKEMANCSWLPFDESMLTSQSLRSGLSQTDMSLIHLTAALNYHKLIQCLLKWRAENPSLVLEIELDAFACDRHECTPLMWSCAKGHYESAILLYRWNRAAINLCNNTGHSPLNLARNKGFQRIVDEIERLENQQTISFNFDNCDLKDMSDNEFRKPRKASLDIPTKAKNICSSTVKRGSACLHYGLTAFPKLVKCFSADSTHPNLSLNSVNDELNVDSIFLSSYISDSEDDLEMSTSSTTGLSSSHRDSIGSCDINMDCNSSQPSRVLTLAEHIIAAMPERIKAASIASLPDEDFDDYYDDNENSNEVESLIANDLNDCETHHQNHNQLSDNLCDFSYEINDNYNYRDANTSANSSPASSSCLHSPGSFPMDTPSPPSPPPTAADFCEFFQASGKITKELGDLTLTDKEQRELYEAAKVIQKAYRNYKGRKRQEEQNKSCDKEKAAAILIQSYYRRYKQYIYYRQMTKAAQVIQNQYRSYCEHKRFKKSANQEVYTVVDGNGQQVNTFICNYSDCEQMQCKNSREGTPFSGLKRTYSQRRRNQAARKIQQFMRQSKNKLQSERALAAEKESHQQEVHSQKAQTTQSVNKRSDES